MYARLLAFVCLLSCSVPIARAETTLVPAATVGVYLQVDVNASSLSLQSMRMELRDLMAPTDINLVWTNGNGGGRIDKLIVVELRGNCRTGSTSETFKNGSALASTSVTDGKVLPFSWVDCGALGQFLGPALVGVPAPDRDEVYGRAMGRLLAHEFYHILAQTESHTSSGISKASFTVGDLLSRTFTFQSDALALLQPGPTVQPLSAQPLQTIAALVAPIEDTLFENDVPLQPAPAAAAAFNRR